MDELKVTADYIEVYGLRFPIIHAEEVHGVIRRQAECPLCRALVKDQKVFDHIDKHDRKANAKERSKMKRELGIKNHKPLPGQLAIPGTGVKDKPKK